MNAKNEQPTTPAPATRAHELIAMLQLSAETLSEAGGVSTVSVYKWIKGGKPRQAVREALEAAIPMLPAWTWDAAPGALFPPGTEPAPAPPTMEPPLAVLLVGGDPAAARKIAATILQSAREHVAAARAAGADPLEIAELEEIELQNAMALAQLVGELRPLNQTAQVKSLTYQKWRDGLLAVIEKHPAAFDDVVAFLKAYAAA